jgi:aspartate carbamoyltransferase catalytic subunit
MNETTLTKSVTADIEAVDLKGRHFLSINDISNQQIYALFSLALNLEKWNRSVIPILPGNVMATLFFQPSTRTRLSFETAMHRLGGMVISESTPLISSSAAKEESLADMLRVVSKYANVIVLRHFDDVDARRAVTYADVPVINGGFGHWEHPTQALLDLYTMWRTFGRIEGLKVCVASPDLIEARTGHSMALGLARLGAEVTLASPQAKRTPEEVLTKVAASNGCVQEVFDLQQDSFNELVSGMDMIYLPGCSAPKGSSSDEFKKAMDAYFVRYDTLNSVYQREQRVIYITHTLPRRQGEMDLKIDNSPSQLYFEAILHSVSIRMALVASIVGWA